jgi:hypothetical protein
VGSIEHLAGIGRAAAREVDLVAQFGALIPPQV